MLKRVGAILLVLSLGFPMSSCSTSSDEAGRTEVQYNYVWTPKDAGEPFGYLLLLSVIWPAISAFSPMKPRRRIFRTAVLVSEPPLLYFTGYVVYNLGWRLGNPEFGAFIASAGLALYGGGRVREVAAWVRGRRIA